MLVPIYSPPDGERTERVGPRIARRTGHKGEEGAAISRTPKVGLIVISIKIWKTYGDCSDMVPVRNINQVYSIVRKGIISLVYVSDG